MELNDESWEKTSHRQTDHRFRCMSYSYWIAQRVSSHNIILQLPCFPTVPSKLPRSLGVLVRTPGTCKRRLLREGFAVFCYGKACSWLMVKCEVIYPNKNTVFHGIPTKYGGKYGCKSWPTPWCAGCCPCPPVSRLASSWTKESNRKLVSNPQKCHKIWQVLYVHLLHFIPKKSLEICIFGSLGFPSFYLQQTSGTFTCNLDESPDIPPISELIQLGPTGRCSSYLPTHKQFLIWKILAFPQISHFFWLLTVFFRVAKQLQFLESCLDLVSSDSSQLQRFKSFALGHQEQLLAAREIPSTNHNHSIRNSCNISHQTGLLESEIQHFRSKDNFQPNWMCGAFLNLTLIPLISIHPFLLHPGTIWHFTAPHRFPPCLPLSFQLPHLLNDKSHHTEPNLWYCWWTKSA